MPGSSKIPDVYPLDVSCSDRGTWVDCPRAALLIWHRIRDPGTSWYCVDYTLLSSTQIRLHVYGMRCNVTGGIGDKVREQDLEIESLTLNEREEITKDLHRCYNRIAERMYEIEQDAIRRARIEDIRKATFGV